jgi:hypothetical protein
MGSSRVASPPKCNSMHIMSKRHLRCVISMNDLVRHFAPRNLKDGAITRRESCIIFATRGPV